MVRVEPAVAVETLLNMAGSKWRLLVFSLLTSADGSELLFALRGIAGLVYPLLDASLQLRL